VCADEFDKNQLNLWVKLEFGNEPVFIPGDIENDTVVSNIIGCVKNGNYLLWRRKGGSFDNIIPEFYWNKRIWIANAKFFQPFSGNDSHAAKLTNFPILGKFVFAVPDGE
jgi:hypothetical protein